MQKLISLLLCCLLAACSSLPHVIAGKHVFSKTHEKVIPKYEPRTKAGNKSPYTVFGKTYTVLPSAIDYKKQGIASWYGKKFHGRNTSNGERFDMYSISAAHKTLPIPSYVKVTNLVNKQSLVLRINDRGPFHGDRIIDLSYAAAVELGFAEQGTTEVLIEAIEIGKDGSRLTANAEPAKPTTIPSDSLLAVDTTPTVMPSKATLNIESPKTKAILKPSIGRYLQLGAYQDSQTANTLAENMRKNLAMNITLLSPAKGMHRVAAGPISDDEELERIKALLLFEGYSETFIVYEFDKPQSQ